MKKQIEILGNLSISLSPHMDNIVETAFKVDDGIISICNSQAEKIIQLRSLWEEEMLLKSLSDIQLARAIDTLKKEVERRKNETN